MNDRSFELLRILNDGRLESAEQKFRLRSVYSRIIGYVDSTNGLRARERRDLERHLTLEEFEWYDLKPLEMLDPGYDELAEISVEYAVRSTHSLVHPMYLYRRESKKAYDEFVSMKYGDFSKVLSEMIDEDLSHYPILALNQVTSAAVPHLKKEMILTRLGNCKGLFLQQYSNRPFYKPYHDFSTGEVLSISSALHAKAYSHKLEFMKLHVAASRWSRQVHHPSDSKRFHDYCLVEARKQGFLDVFSFANFAKENRCEIPYFPKLHDFFEQQRRV